MNHAEHMGRRCIWASKYQGAHIDDLCNALRRLCAVGTTTADVVLQLAEGMPRPCIFRRFMAMERGSS